MYSGNKARILIEIQAFPKEGNGLGDGLTAQSFLPTVNPS